MRKISIITLLATAVFVFILPVSLASEVLTFDDLLRCKRISEPKISPDGFLVAFTVRQYDEEKDDFSSDLYLVTVANGAIKQLTTHSAGDYHPVWSNDGKEIYFISTRTGKPQIWVIPIDGGEARQVTDFYSGISGFTLSPDGTKIAFHTEVYPDCPDQECNRKRDEMKPEINVKVYDKLLFRHWDSWEDGKRKHIFLYDMNADVYTDLTPGDYDSPPEALGWGYDFSPDGKRIAFSSNHDPVVATSTNNDIWEVSIDGENLGRITTSRGNDTAPAYSPDGKYIAYLSMKRPGFESDKFVLTLYDRFSNNTIALTDTFTYSVSSFLWLPDGENLLFTANQRGRKNIFLVNMNDRSVRKVVDGGYNYSLNLFRKGEQIIFLRSTSTSPAEAFLADLKTGSFKPLTELNAALLRTKNMNPPEDFWFEGADDTPVHGFVIPPPGFDPAKKYPMLLLIHGGPQGMWSDSWGYRWNAQLFAAQGYVVVMINPRGSRGYGQKFTDEITRDWGGAVYTDLMKGVDYVIAKYPFIDSKRLGAAGASFGGYMIAWIEGHTNRFKCLVDHDGVYNLFSFYGSTEELWFPEWEFGGPPWKDIKNYLLLSPSNYVKNFQTPCLIIQGGRDYRVDQSEGFQFFTHLQRRGIPSKLVYFPDEGHWVLNHKNSRFWYQTVFEWLAEYLNP